MSLVLFLQIQFVTIVGHTCLVLYMDCGFPPAYAYALLAYAISHIVLFSNFYHKSYIKKKRLASSDHTKES